MTGTLRVGFSSRMGIIAGTSLARGFSGLRSALALSGRLANYRDKCAYSGQFTASEQDAASERRLSVRSPNGMVRHTLMTSDILKYGYRLMSVSVLVALVACASSTWDGQVYRGDSINFRAGRVPPGWRRLDNDNSLLTFRDSRRDLVITVNGRCGRDGDDVPLASLTQHLFMYFTERQIVTQGPITLDGREALRTELSANLDGVARRFIVYVLKKNGCVYDFILIAGPWVDANTTAEFDQFVAGFSTSTTHAVTTPKYQVPP